MNGQDAAERRKRKGLIGLALSWRNLADLTWLLRGYYVAAKNLSPYPPPLVTFLGALQWDCLT